MPVDDFQSVMQHPTTASTLNFKHCPFTGAKIIDMNDCEAVRSVVLLLLSLSFVIPPSCPFLLTIANPAFSVGLFRPCVPAS